ncbi:hypothetical protein I203_100147 [Kwoniella mangroviensis CBS 8507]|uniref:uncharacterized protein n=1 Tax=Kwoniella mangroviensis CBS 8507 TaxID=1296122 RepID=UPI00080D688C|nr:uncharacterized protein I203_08052 [Kwoniella mangroviensis CBS 8507]OCF62829.1 hypothetical protein I203_08052 [Kwoniella mangroviensis CBS 8507]
MTTTEIPVIPCPRPFSDHIAGTVNGVDLPLRVWPAIDKDGQVEKDLRKRPWLMWIHGGAFMYGKHYVPNAWVIPACRSLSYHIVSVSYRFVPQVTHYDIINDIQIAYQWCRPNLSSVLGENAVDLETFAVGGDSAGGHLALWCGNHFSPPPKLILDVYGLSAPEDPFYALKVENLPLPILGTSEEELEVALNDRSPENIVVTSAFTLELEPFMTVENLKIAWGVDYTPTKKDIVRADLNAYTFKNGLKMGNIFRRDKFETEEEYKQELRKWGAMYHIQEDEPYPSVFILHGKNDTIVPVSQSYQPAEKLRKMDVDVGENYVDGMDHIFETYLAGPEDPMWDIAIVPLIEFMKKHLG